MIIGIGGNKGSGKSTLADSLVKQHRYTVITFAGPLKEALTHMLNVPYEVFEVQDLKTREFEVRRLDQANIADFLEYLSDNYINIDYGLINALAKKFNGLEYRSYRQLMQLVGTELVRDNVSEQYWINCARLNTKRANSSNIVFSDARFPNERAYVKEINGTTVLIKRGDEVNDGHSSEKLIGGVDDYDVVVYNDDSVSRLIHEFSVWYSLVKGRG